MAEISMIEKVARVLEPQAWAALGVGDTLAYENRRKSSLRKARAAIEVMREPTAAMIKEGERIQRAVLYDDPEASPGAIYIAMIDVALKEREEHQP